MNTELYDVLEIKSTATEQEIKTAYRKLATKWHPDKNPKNKEEATKMFQQIQEANEILSDPEKRNQYDNHGLNGSNGNMPDMGGFNPFADMMGGFMGNNNRTKEEKQIINLKITLENIFNGFTKKFKITSKNKCMDCNASVLKCNECNGVGSKMMIKQHGMMMQQLQIPCQKCNKTGKITNKSNCNNCNGCGIINKITEQEIIFNKNDDYLKQIRLVGLGNYNFNTKKNDDLYIQFEVQKMDDYEIRSHDLIKIYTIDIKNALTGFNIHIHHPNGKSYNLINHFPIKDNDIKVIPKLGIPSSYSSGDLIIKFIYNYPKQLLKSLDEYMSIIEVYNSNYETIELLDYEKYKNENNEDEKQQPHQQCQQM